MFIPLKALRDNLCATVLLCLGTLTSGVSYAEKIAMESASANSIVGMIPQAMAPYWSKAGVDVQLALNQTLTKSLLKIARGKLDSALVPPPAFAALQKGVGPYANIAQMAQSSAKNVRALFTLPGSYYHAITWADSGIKNWQDGKGKRVFIGPPAGAANRQITALAAAGGLPEGSYKEIKVPWGTATQSFQDGQFDIYVGVFGLGSQSLSELSLSHDIRILGVKEENRIPPVGKGMQTAIIPANTYPGQVNKKEVISWQTLMMMAVNKDLSDDTAYTLTKTYVENRMALANSSATFKDLAKTDYFVGVNAPLHSGAVKYYREMGISIPTKLLP